MQNTVYVKNLMPGVDVSRMCDFFRKYGAISSASVECNKKDGHLWKGYIQFENLSSAISAATEMNGNKIIGHPLCVTLGIVDEYFAKIFVKNFDRSWDECDLMKIFNPFGEIEKVHISEADGKSNGFGFVIFKKHVSAKNAVKAMHDKVIGNEKLIVKPYIAKESREYQKAHSLEHAKEALEKTAQRNNLFVKNLPKNVTDDEFQKMFERFGEIQNILIARDDSGMSKGFGFVCFKKEDDAQRARLKMDGLTFNSQKLVVDYKQQKEARKNYLHLKNLDSEPAKAAAKTYKQTQKYASSDAFQSNVGSFFSFSAKRKY